jgi:Bacterial Ig-like domain (group 3)/FG-GAP-like repeat/Putative Ig domain/FG-GAP repeat
MKPRLVVSLLVVICLMGVLELARGGGALATRSSKALLHGSAGVKSALLAAARPQPMAAMPQGPPPPTGPSPVSYLSAGVYQNPSHPNNSGVADVAFGDFNGDGNKDILTADGSACISVVPGDGTGHFSGTPIDSCGFPTRNISYVATADFNGDGIPDVAVAATTFGTITLMMARGNGDGTFTYLSTISSFNNGGEFATSLKAVDLNNDGKIDLVMTSSGSGSPNFYTTYIFLGDGNFGFAQNGIRGVGSCPRANGLAIGDFNHDGVLDLAVTNAACGVNEVDVMLGKGDGTFNPAVGYAPGTGAPTAIAAGHFHSAPDGIIDLVVMVGGGGSPIVSFLGNGDGTFGSPNSSPSVYDQGNLAVGDFNGDGEDDVIISSNSSGYFAGDLDGVQLSNGDGTFAAPVQYSVLANPTRVYVTDLNGDGQLDWVSLSNGSEYFCVGLGDGSGAFLAAVDRFTTPGDSGATSAIAAADFNKDGNLDYATVGYDYLYPSLDISLGDGSGNFAPPVQYAAGSNPSALTIGDFNHDGYPDIAVLDQSDGQVSVLLNKGDGTLANAVSYAVGAGGGYIQTADFNGDGIPDLIVTNSSDGTVSVLLGNSDGTFQSQRVSTSMVNGSYLAVADFNNDGKLDAAVSSYGGQSVSILLGNSDGTFQAPISVSDGLQIACGLAAGDFNKDGNVDLAVCGQLINNGSNGYGGAAILMGNGNATFSSPLNYPTVPVGLNGNPVTYGTPRVADLNNDGNLDIVIPNEDVYANGVNLGPAILLGKGDGTFILNPAQPAITGTYQGDIALGDFNNDGFLDMAVQNFDPTYSTDTGTSTVTMLLSTSSSSVIVRSAQNCPQQGCNVIFTAGVGSSFTGLPLPTGTITFQIGTIKMTVPLVNDVATFETTSLPVGSTTYFATYSGDANYNPNVSLGGTVTVLPGPLAIATTNLPNAVQDVSYSGSVSAMGGTPPYSFSLAVASNPLPTGLTLNGDGSITGKATGAPGTSSFSVQVRDSANAIATAGLSITVIGSVQITTTSLPAGVVGNSYSANLSATGGVSPYTFSIVSGSLPIGISLAGGVFSGVPALSTAGQTFSFTVQAQDSNTPADTATANLSITVTAALSITTTSLPNGVQNVAYTPNITVTGGVAPYTFTITSGAPPSGITLSSSGTFSGSTSVVGTSGFTVQAKDSSAPAQSVTANLSITINSTLAFTTAVLPGAVVNNAYNTTITASGGIPSYTFSVTGGNLPAGLTLSNSGGITGTPTGPAGTSNFTVQVKDSNTPADTASENLSINVGPALSIITVTLANGVQNIAYNSAVAAQGGVAPYAFTITNGSLPSGITMTS